MIGKVMLAEVLILFWPFTLWAFFVDARIREAVFHRGRGWNRKWGI